MLDHTTTRADTALARAVLAAPETPLEALVASLDSVAGLIRDGSPDKAEVLGLSVAAQLEAAGKGRTCPCCLKPWVPSCGSPAEDVAAVTATFPVSEHDPRDASPEECERFDEATGPMEVIE